VVGANFGALDGPVSCMSMDWGTLIPLYFMGRRSEVGGRPRRVKVGPWEAGAGQGEPPRPEVVVVGPGREAPWDALVRLGEVVAGAALACRRRVAFVASADHGHAHLAGGPYGFHPASDAYDREVCGLIRRGELEGLLDLDPALVEAAKADSLWPMLILLGVLRKVPMTAELLTYQVPTYFGMLVASFEPSAGSG